LEPWNQDAKTKLREKLGLVIEKKGRGTLEGCRDLSRTKK
jgi:hypothetical protein